eukprot:gene8212-biopygen1571
MKQTAPKGTGEMDYCSKNQALAQWTWGFCCTTVKPPKMTFAGSRLINEFEFQTLGPGAIWHSDPHTGANGLRRGGGHRQSGRRHIRHPQGETATPASGPRPVRVRFFEWHRAPRVRSASAAVFPRGTQQIGGRNGSGRGPDTDRTRATRYNSKKRTRTGRGHCRFSQCGAAVVEGTGTPARISHKVVVQVVVVMVWGGGAELGCTVHETPFPRRIRLKTWQHSCIGRSRGRPPGGRSGAGG